MVIGIKLQAFLCKVSTDLIGRTSAEHWQNIGKQKYSLINNAHGFNMGINTTSNSEFKFIE